jgi:hypothetical protein
VTHGCVQCGTKLIRTIRPLANAAQEAQILPFELPFIMVDMLGSVARVTDQR